MRMYRLLLLGMIGLIVSVGFGFALAQDAAPPAFATNTPPAALPGFATNTPQLSLAALLPGATFDRYALRLWDEPALTALLLEQVRLLRPGEDDRKMAIRLLQHELTRRFPGAPRDLAVRQELIVSMLAAPRASIDLRAAIRPYIAYALNQIRPSFLGVSSFDYAGFNITILSANLDGDVEIDAVIQTRYPAVVSSPAEIRYQDFVMAQLDSSGVYHLLEADTIFPAAPLDEVQSINMERLGDLNRDGLDELAVSTRGAGVNQQLQIFGYRNSGIANLVVPGRVLLFGSIADWPMGSDSLSMTEYRLESPAWNCLGEREITWRWQFNFFRPPPEPADFAFQDRLPCFLYAAEPLFVQPLDEAISTIQSLLPRTQPDDETAAQRAAMTVAMLRVLNGDVSEALDQVRGLQASAQSGSWLASQTEAFLDAANQSNSTPLQLCAALHEANSYGACDVDQVLTRLFAEQPLSRGTPIAAQLAALGIDIIDADTRILSAIGRLDRQVVHFVLAGDHWWAFAPLQADTYTAEKVDPPPSALLDRPPPPIVDPPQAAYRALLVDGDPTTALNILDNVIRENAPASLASSGYFLQAVSYDLIGDRANARRAYFDLWSSDPRSLWGQLAAAHLEQR